VNFVAKEKVVLTLGSPLGVRVRVISVMVAFAFTGAGLLTKLTGVGPEMRRIYSSITTGDYL